MSIIAIITARGGSKRIPKKNIKDFMGKPMIAYAIEAAENSKIFDEIMVSTDDAEIKAAAENSGAKVPFMRSEKTSNDFAVTIDVLKEVIAEYKKLGKEFDEICCIYPCAPFLTGGILKEAYNKFKISGADRLTPAVKYSFPIQRAFKADKEGFISFREPENALKRSQDLEPMYHDAGMFYFYKKDKLESGNIIMYELDDAAVQDIDTIDDWKTAELKYKIMMELT